MLQHFYHSKISKFCSICLSIIIIVGCGDEDNNYIPEIPVHVELNLTSDLLPLGVGETALIIPDEKNQEMSQLIFPGSPRSDKLIPWHTFGKGLIIYRYDFYVYWAFDRTCTYYKPPQNYCGLEITDNMLVPVCPCCSSKFIITAGGGPVKGSKAIKNLVEYPVMLTQNNTRLIISRN